MPQVWPTTLPKSPLLEGFSETPPELVTRSQTDTGPAITRARFTAGPTMISVSWMMSAEQHRTFKNFYRGNLKGGAVSFIFPHPVTGLSTVVRIRDVKYTYPSHRHVKVTATIEQLP